MMNPMGGQSQFSDEDLRKLAQLLQQMPQGEGLASVTKQEQNLMKDAGGSGTPLPGTEGLGPGGGPVQSYAKKEDGIIDEDHRLVVATNAEIGAMQFIKEQEKGQGYSSGNGPLIQALSALSKTEPDYYNYKDMRIPTLNDQTGNEGDSGGGGSSSSSSSSGGPPGGGATSHGSGADVGGGSSYGTSYGDQSATGGGTTTYGGGSGAAGQTPSPTPKPEKPFDAYLSPEENAWLKTQPEEIQNLFRSPAPTPEAKQELSNKAYTQMMAKAYQEAGERYPQESITEYHARYMKTLAKNESDSGISSSSSVSGLPPPVPQTFTDSKGNEWPTQAAADAANKAIKEARAVQVPAMVESMNSFFKGPNTDENTTFDEWVATVPAEQRGELEESVLRTMYENARTKFQRGEAFTLTPEEVAEFSRTAIQTGEVADAEKTTLGEVADATLTDVGEVADVTPTEVAAIADVTDEDMDAVFAGGIDAAEALLLKRVSGETTSPAEEQLKRTTENNIRLLLGATAGGDANPAKIRQLKNIWSDMQQQASGQAAELRSQEQLEAESKLIELYKGKSTMKLNQKLANMEKERLIAMKNGDLESLRKITNQATSLQRVITKASLDVNTKLANLDKLKELAIQQGKLDVATKIANMEKNLTLATVDAKLTVDQKAMDDAVAIAAYKGEQALYGLEAEIDIETMKSDLQMMGFELTRDLAELDSATQIKVAELTGQWRRAQGNDQKQAAIIGAIGTVIAAYAKTSDIRAKTNISAADSEVESFLDALNAYQYEYRDPDAPGADPGMFTGVMAQDLEKSPMGASFVQDTPQGKMVDYGHGLAAILASQANIHDRLKQLEEV